MEITGAVGKWHLAAHILECFPKFSLNFVEGTGEDQPPKTVDRAVVLSMRVQPFKEGRIRIGGRPLKAGESPGNTELFSETQKVSAQETEGQMQGRRPGVGLEPCRGYRSK